MSLPVPHLPGEVRHEIRNTRDGNYFFVPTELVCRAFQFILATGLRRYRVGLVAYAMMGSHIHILVVDLGDAHSPSDIPGFRKFVRSTFAQFIKWYWERDNGRIFCPDSTGCSVNVLDFASMEEAIAYIETNPMSAGLEKSPERMQGAVSLRKWLIAPKTVVRPSVYFQRRSWRDSEELALCVPPGARAIGHDEASFYQVTKAAVDRRVKQIARERKRAGLKFRPLYLIRRLRPEAGKTKSAADHSEALLATKDPYLAALEFNRVRIFRAQHRRALKRLREGEADVVFPAGTYAAAKRYGVKVETSIVSVSLMARLE